MAGTIATMLVQSRRGEHISRTEQAQRVDIAEREVFIKGAKDELLRIFVVVSSGKLTGSAVLCSVLRWRRGWDSNPRYGLPHAGFQDRCLKPLGHPSSGKSARNAL